MSGHVEYGPAMATARIPGRRRRLLLWMFAAVAGCSLVLAGALGVWLHGGRREEDLHDRFPRDILANYVPADSVALLSMNVRQLREAPNGRGQSRPHLKRLLTAAERHLPWLDLTGIDLIDDIDTILISFPSEGCGGPMLAAQGRFDRTRFQIGPDKLQKKLLYGFRIWEYRDRPADQETLLAIIGDTLVVSSARNRVQAALKYASSPQPSPVHDPILRRLMLEGDRRQCLWLAAATKQLGTVSEIDDYLLKMILRPLLARAESVSGGIDCAEDFQLELRLSTASDEDAAQLDADLKSICEAAHGVLLLGRQTELQLLLRLFAASQIRAEGRTILLHNQLTADQLKQ